MRSCKFNLIKAAMLAEDRGFNRQLKTETLGQIPLTLIFPVMHVFAHFHWEEANLALSIAELEVWLSNPGTDVLIEAASERLVPHTIDVPIAFFNVLCAQCDVKEVEQNHV